MGNISKTRRNVSIQFGMWSIILCMVAGRVMNMRPLIILERSAISFAITATLGYILVLVIQIHSRFEKKAPAKKQEEQDPEVNAEESQNNQGDVVGA